MFLVMADDTEKLSFFQRTEALMRIVDEADLEPFFGQLSALQMQDFRNFLENQLIYLATIKKETILGQSIIRSKYEPAAEYYRRQNCGEVVEACLDESCHPNNPVCFSMKMSLQIKVLLDLLKPYLEKPAAE
jgi:hypothetical protein